MAELTIYSKPLSIAINSKNWQRKEVAYTDSIAYNGETNATFAIKAKLLVSSADFTKLLENGLTDFDFIAILNARYRIIEFAIHCEESEKVILVDTQGYNYMRYVNIIFNDMINDIDSEIAIQRHIDIQLG